MRKLWREGAIEAVLEFLEDKAILELLEDTAVGQWWLTGGARAPRGKEAGEGEISEGEEGGPGPP